MVVRNWSTGSWSGLAGKRHRECHEVGLLGDRGDQLHHLACDSSLIRASVSLARCALAVRLGSPTRRLISLLRTVQTR
jgi:hypothetical protein